MMDLKEIVKCYPEHIQQQGFKRDMLREYLQHEILKSIFESKHALAYTFLGGACLRLVYGTERFLEGLDFDNADSLSRYCHSDIQVTLMFFATTFANKNLRLSLTNLYAIHHLIFFVASGADSCLHSKLKVKK
ncbi:MAG: hypothetical protein AAGG68_01675 [Bacteroidota bacterium]